MFSAVTMSERKTDGFITEAAGDHQSGWFGEVLRDATCFSTAPNKHPNRVAGSQSLKN